MQLERCDNCNGDNGGATMTPIRVVAGTDNVMDSIANYVWRAGDLCDPCVRVLRRLDFETFAERHAERPRVTELP